MHPGGMALDVRFEDGPAAGRSKHYAYLSTALPSLAWTGEQGEIQAVYHRAGEQPDAGGVWHYRRADVARRATSATVA
jgi:hypothetical protein